jgi:hypothetical protein
MLPTFPAKLLVIDATSCPNHPKESVLRECMDAWDKLLVKRALEKTKIIIKLFFNFRQLCISLPNNKFIAWTMNTNKLLVNRRSTTKELEWTIEQLRHFALVVSGDHNFLSRPW